MNKLIMLFLITTSFVWAQEYYAKVQPIHTYKISAAVSGKVEYVNKAIEAKYLNEKTLIVKLDDTLDQVDLKQSLTKLKALKEIQQLEEENLQRFQQVSSKSKFDKDNQRIRILNALSMVSDLEIKVASLKDSIDNKNLYGKELYIYDIGVEEGNFVNPGTHLYTAQDISRGKLEIFIPIDKADLIQTKKIYLDGKQTDLKISKLYKVADEQHISSYKCEIFLEDPKTFSQLVKVEFK